MSRQNALDRRLYQLQDWIDRRDNHFGERDERRLVRVIVKRATGPTIGEPADMPRWLARLITFASAAFVLAVIVSCLWAAVIIGHTITTHI